MMQFRFISPESHGRVADITIEADDLPAAFEIFVEKHWDVHRHSFGVWKHGDLIARVYTHMIDLGNFEPHLHELRSPGLSCLLEPSKN